MHYQSRKQSRQRASLFTEYAVILTVVLMALISMNTYMKRGLQGRLKGMTDEFISYEQVADINTGGSTSFSNTTFESRTNQRGLPRGGTSVQGEETRELASEGLAVDEKAPLNQSELVSANQGRVTIKAVPTEQGVVEEDDEKGLEARLKELQVKLEIDDQVSADVKTDYALAEQSEQDWRQMNDIRSLQRTREMVLAESNSFSAYAERLDAEIIELIGIRGDHCGKKCRPRVNQVIDKIAAKAAVARVQARELRQEAEEIGLRIEELGGSVSANQPGAGGPGEG